jgi:hypothetical protein
MEKTQQEDINIRALLKQKNKQGACLSLQKRKMYETELNRQQNMVNNLVKQKFTLEAAEDMSAVFETLSLATATSK